MLDTEFLTILGLGLVLGLRHALDTDHLAAVSTMLAQRPSLRASGMIGLSWGLGHTVVLLLAGAVVLVLRVSIPEPMALAAEFAVGMMLVFLGGMLAIRLVRERWHVHAHDHDGAQHMHLHSHALVEDHGHGHWWRDSIRPFCVGMAHGLAGSAALLLIVLSSARSLSEGLMYISVFGFGSIVGMVLVGMVVSLPVLWSLNLGRPVFLALQGLASLGSVVVGFTMMYQIAFGGQLF
ncbi:MAG: urease accessory protein [Nitrospira sp. CG24A]|nr:MAG: urease accessory protein [Nitrospira sp. CG24A]